MPVKTTLCFFLFLFFFSAGNLFAQKKEIVGIVKDSIELTPIAGAIVKALDANGKTVSFAVTDKAGEYKLMLDTTKDPRRIVFHLISYAEKEVELTNSIQRLDVFLSQQSIALREVTVKAPDIILKKDTLSYLVSAFLKGSDRTIEDVLKRMPGINVAGDGKISYQGKNISKFNIEGLDMLGGKYTLASTNIRAKDVKRVDVIENYQEVKQLQGKEHSDDVAIDLKLTEEAKMRLIGNAEIGGGIRESEGLYHGAITGMSFAPKVQFIGTAKANNFGSRLSRETIDHFGQAFTSNIANTAMGGEPVQYPSLAFPRYQEKNEQLVSLNSIIKTSENETFRVNADYNREESSFRYETINTYLTDGSQVVINEKSSPDFLSDILRAGLKYQLNSANLFVANTTFFYTKKADNHFRVVSNGHPVEQDKTNRLTTIRNEFNFSKTIRKRQYKFNSTLNYSYQPDYLIAFAGVPEVRGDYYQEGSGKTFTTINNTSFNYDLSRVSKLGLALALNADYNNIHTALHKNDSIIQNKNDGYKITTSASLDYRLLSLDQRYGLTLRMPVILYLLDYRNRIDKQAGLNENYIYVNPSLNAHYLLSALTKITLYGGYNNQIGDLTDFLINPIQTSYNQQSAKTGILSSNQSLSSSLKIEYKNPMKLFFSNGSVSYRHTERNILNAQTITPDSNGADINTSGIAESNVSQNISFNGSVSKRFKPVSTTVSLDAGYAMATGSQMRQNIKMDTRSNSFSLTPRIETQIIEPLDLTYRLNYSRSFYKSGVVRSTYHQQSHDIRAEYKLIQNLFLHLSVDIGRKEITENNYVTMTLLDAGAKYKAKRFEIELKLNNLLNTKEYRYTIHSELDNFTYTYHLNPFEGVLVCRFNL